MYCMLQLDIQILPRKARQEQLYKSKNPTTGFKPSCLLEVSKGGGKICKMIRALLLSSSARCSLVSMAPTSQVLRPTSYGKWVGGPMSLKQGNFSFRARTAHNWLRMGEYGTYLEFCRSHEAPKHCQTLDSPTQSCARAHFRSPPGRPQVAPRSPPVDCHCNEIWIHCLKEISDRNAMAIKLGANWGQTGGNLK